jgi:hypothetical protein
VIEDGPRPRFPGDHGGRFEPGDDPETILDWLTAPRRRSPMYHRQ